MQDRIPVNPGRVLISPENGAPYYATMTRADNATQEGTPLNKNSLLRDATAAQFGLGADAVPDDVFRVMSRFQNNLGNEYVWSVNKVTTEFLKYEILSDKQFQIQQTEFSGGTYPGKFWAYASQYEFVDGGVALVNPTVVEVRNDLQNNITSVLKGKYCYCSAEQLSVSDVYDFLYFVPFDAVCEIKYSNPNYYIYFSTIAHHSNIGEVSDTQSFVNSFDRNAYPPAIDDGYTYTALGQLGNKTQIATGSYTGTGNSGSSNKNKLTFDFVPKFVIIQGSKYYSNMPAHYFGLAVLAQGLTGGFGSFGYSYTDRLSDSSNTYGVIVSWSGNTVSWYNHSNASAQLNTSGTTYNYIAIC